MGRLARMFRPGLFILGAGVGVDLAGLRQAQLRRP
jgi:hypothetical protein